MGCQRLTDDSVARFQAETAAAYDRLMVLDDYARGAGLTAEEQAERRRIKTLIRERLHDLLASNAL